MDVLTIEQFLFISSSIFETLYISHLLAIPDCITRTHFFVQKCIFVAPKIKFDGFILRKDELKKKKYFHT